MRAIIVDDEYETLEEIKDIAKEFSGLEVVGIYTNPLKALEEIEKVKPDLAILDIEMPGMHGIDLAEKILSRNSKIEIVFITAFNQYAIQAFEVCAFDYILKPLNINRFRKTIERLFKKIKDNSVLDVGNIAIKSLGNFEIIADGNLIRWSRSKAKELLAYLLHFAGKQRSKYKICEDLWAECEPKKSLINLQTTICSLRKSLGDIGRKHLKIEFIDESYILNIGNIFWDVSEFEKLYFEFMKNGDIEIAQKAISLYQGEYMGSEDWLWCQITAENISQKYDKLLETLAEKYYKNAQFLETKEVIVKLLERQMPENHIQLMLLDSVYQKYGVAGLKKQIQILQNIYQDIYDLPIETEILNFCKKKGAIS